MYHISLGWSYERDCFIHVGYRSREYPATTLEFASSLQWSKNSDSFYEISCIGQSAQSSGRVIRSITSSNAEVMTIHSQKVSPMLLGLHSTSGSQSLQKSCIITCNAGFLRKWACICNQRFQVHEIFYHTGHYSSLELSILYKPSNLLKLEQVQQDQ